MGPKKSKSHPVFLLVFPYSTNNLCFWSDLTDSSELEAAVEGRLTAEDAPELNDDLLLRVSWDGRPRSWGVLWISLTGHKSHAFPRPCPSITSSQRAGHKDRTLWVSKQGAPGVQPSLVPTCSQSFVEALKERRRAPRTRPRSPGRPQQLPQCQLLFKVAFLPSSPLSLLLC